MKLLYATANPGKLMELRALMRTFGLEMIAPDEIRLALDVPEDGDSLEANAAAKARAYVEHLADPDVIVLGDDTGVEIDALGGEPGIHVRRWIGRRMTDQEILDHCLARMAHVPPGERGAQFRTVFAVGQVGRPIALFDGTLRGEILSQPDPLRIEGFPFESIFYVPEWKLLLGAVHQLPPAEKVRFVTHRERALRRALPYLRMVMDGRSAGG